MERQFTSGSRQAPDPFDQFLEEHQFYRKHTARDASCLFRVISEQMYDTQLHHLVIREKCVTYMRKHRKYFDYLVDRDFDEYLDDMSKPKTYGTLLELQAASYMFERNVFLFQPFNLGNYFDEYRSNFMEVFRVFYTPERHFDSVFTSDYIQEAAICQSICYEILYKDLFKLPDVSFAVEQMLYGHTFENMDYRTETNEDGYPTRLHISDGRYFELDLPDNTNCILENYKLCHFHYSNFPRYSDEIQRELKNANNFEESEKHSLIIQRTTESFLPKKYVSCVRQLLLEGITPFPYKVSKALDPNMYRNIEFDSWNEMRKETKLQNWYNGDANFKLIRYSTRRVRKIFQVGAKCHVKLRKSEQDLYTCHIQEIGVDRGQCIVFVEQLGEKRLVPYENLTPLPPDQFKPWTVPYRLQRHMQKYSSVRFTRQYNYRLKLNTTTAHNQLHEYSCESAMDSDSCSNNYIDDDPKKLVGQQQNQHCTAAASYFKLKQYTHLEDFRTHVEYCTLPITIGNSNREVEESANACNQSSISDLNEISRSPSTSSTSVGIHRNNKGSSCNFGEDLFGRPLMDEYEIDRYNRSGSYYMPENHGFYPMQQYTEDFYGRYGVDGFCPAHAAQTAPVMSPMNNINGLYYYNYPPNTLFVQPSPPPQSVGVHQYAPICASANTTNSSCYTQSPFTIAASGSTPCNLNLAPMTSNLQSLPPISLATNTSPKLLNRRINYDAKKSVKANGSDLPKDIQTLRFFYNKGLETFKKTQSDLGCAETNNDQLPIAIQTLKIVGDSSDVNKNKISQSETSHSNQLVSFGNRGNNNNNQRRYNCRNFGGKDRQMPQRNSSSVTSKLSVQQQQFTNYAQHNQRSNNNNVKISNNNNLNASTRNSQQQQENNQIYKSEVEPENSTYLPHVEATEYSQQNFSNNCAIDETLVAAHSATSASCQTPTAINNSVIAVAYSNNSDQLSDEITPAPNNNVQYPITTHSQPGGLFIPIPMAHPPPPHPPYGIFPSHPATALPHQSPGMGINQNFITVAPPQIITQCGAPPPQQQDNGNSSSGSDGDIFNIDFTVNNGSVLGLPSPNMPIQCSSYTPSIPLYFPANAASSVSGGGLVAPFTTQVPSAPTSSQTAFTTVHPPMSNQAYYCLPPSPLLLTPQQVATHMAQQATTPSPSKTASPSKGQRNDTTQ